MNTTELTTILAGGCFWGVEELFRKEMGITSTRVGYSGGTTLNPTYETVKMGQTGHAECIEITFNPELTNYTKIFQFFFSIHDPTTINQQGNDRGSQYRSAIFYQNKEEKNAAELVIKELNKKNIWKKEIITEVLALDKFYDAESYHQDYLQKNPGGYTCHFQRYIPG